MSYNTTCYSFKTKRISQNGKLHYYWKMDKVWSGFHKCCAQQQNVDSLGNRGMMTEICGVEAFKQMKFVIANLHKIPHRCKAVLKKLKIKEKDSWGKGLLIFSPHQCLGFAYGTKNWFLPLIINAPIDSICTAYEDAWMKDRVHKNIVQQWNKWLGNHYLLSEDDTKCMI